MGISWNLRECTYLGTVNRGNAREKKEVKMSPNSESSEKNITYFGPFLAIPKGCKNDCYILARVRNFKFVYEVGVETMCKFKSDFSLGLAFRV